MPPMCVACRRDAKTTYALGPQEICRLHTDCATCGSYEAQTGAWEYLKDLTPSEPDFALQPYLSAHLRQTTDTAELVVLTTDNWRGLAQSHAATPVAEKLRKLLECAARRTSVGEWLYLADVSSLSAASDVRDAIELNFILTHLNDRDLITYQSIPPPVERRNADGSCNSPEQAIQLTVDGWEAVAPIAGVLPARASSPCRSARILILRTGTESNWRSRRRDIERFASIGIPTMKASQIG